MKVTAQNYIAEVLAGKKDAAGVFMGYGSHCLNCGNTTFKTVADMAEKHGVDLETLLAELNRLPDSAAAGKENGLGSQKQKSMFPG